VADPSTVIPAVRESVAAILRIRMTRPETEKKGKVRSAQFQAALGGSAFCVVADRYLVTAFHVLKGAQPRYPADRFYAFTVPGNGDPASHFPVTAFPVERPDLDIAVLEIGPCATAGIHIPAVLVSFAPRPNGARVVTVGFSAPEIVGLKVSAQADHGVGQFLLKSHADEGIVSATYSLGPTLVYEFNVGWRHGESGGSVAALADQPAVFTLMQLPKHPISARSSGRTSPRLCLVWRSTRAHCIGNRRSVSGLSNNEMALTRTTLARRRGRCSSSRC
jgi:hypothetical protein